MIFVTVGTHEQQFNRLVKYMDDWAMHNDEEVIIQIGYSTYEPRIASWSRLYPYKKMVELVDKARIVVTHGGPSSFIMPLQVGKLPIVVPRQIRYSEHVNNHQVKFVKEVEQRLGTIVVVEDIDSLGEIIDNYENIKRIIVNNSNNSYFCMKLENIVNDMF